MKQQQQQCSSSMSLAVAVYTSSHAGRGLRILQCSGSSVKPQVVSSSSVSSSSSGGARDVYIL
jgi:hypothetical protein